MYLFYWNTCYYVSEFSNITKKIQRCEIGEVSQTRKQVLELLIKKEIERYGNNKKNK